MNSILIFVLLLAYYTCYVLATPTVIQYPLGKVLQYQVNGELDARGQLQRDQSKTHGDTSTIKGTLLMKATKHEDGHYLIVMNMFDVMVGVGQSNDLKSNSEPLGYDMYFQQEANGKISKIWYNTADSAYFVNIKVAAINAFQTEIIAPEKTIRFQEEDPVGLHFTEGTGVAGNDLSLVIKKSFNTEDVEAFSDKNTKKQNVRLNSMTTTTIHSSGYIQSAVVEQEVSFQQHKIQVNRNLNAQDDVFNTLLSSSGKLTIHQVSQTLDFQKMPFKSTEELIDANYHESSMMLWAGSAEAKFSEIVESPQELLEAIMGNEKHSGKIRRQLRKFIALTEEDGKLFDMLNPYIDEYENLPEFQRDRVLYILSGLPQAQSVISQLIEKEPLRGLIAAQSVSNPNDQLLNTVWNHYVTKGHGFNRVALFCFGTLLSKLDTNRKSSQVSLLVTELEKAVEKGDTEHIIAIFFAFKNAEVKLPEAVMNQLSLEQKQIIQNILRETTPFKEDPDYPFYKEYKGNYSVGGESVGASFNADLFAGSSKLCSGEEYFNYKALAEGVGNAHVFGKDFNLITARALYAKKNGVQVGNQLYLSVFDKVYYDKTLPVVDCSEHLLPLKKFTIPGFHYSQVVFISIVPVTFEVGVDAAVDLEFGWQICDSTLSAKVEFIPRVDLIASGAAEINLLIIKAGLELDLDVNAALVPSVEASGTKCEIDFALDLKCAPQDAVFEAFYQIKKCKFFFFDCKWEKKNVYKIFEFKSDGLDKQLYKKVFPIGQ